MNHKSGFWKIFMGSSFVTFVNMLRAFAVNKLLAVFLSPSMFACIAQFVNFMNVGQAFSSLSLQNGWVSLTAQNKDNLEKLHGVWRGGIRLTTFASVFTFVVMVIAAFILPLDTLLPGIPSRLSQAAIIFALPGIFAMNVITISASVMNGLHDYRRWGLINVVSSVWQILWVAFFLYTGHLSVLSVIATQSIVCALFAMRIASRAGFSFKKIRASLIDLRSPWISFALMGILPMVMTPVVLTFIRSTVGLSFGWNAAGIWQGIWKISDFFAAGFSAILGVIVLPKVNSGMGRIEFFRWFDGILLRIMGVSFLVAATVYFLRYFVVSLFLSKAYAGAVDYMLPQLVGDFFRSGGWALGLVLVARRETKIFLATEMVALLFLAIASVAGMKIFGFYGPMFAYACENFIYFVALFVVVRRLKWNIR